jgi:uncharacterized membrane protein YphA (DoxX/SURF4 family)
MTNALDLAARLFLGLEFFYFGLNGFFNWRPLPPPSEAMGKFVAAWQETGYLMTVVKFLETLTGLCLLTGFFVPLALLGLAPLIFGIVSLQLFLNEGKGWGISAQIAIPYFVLIFTRWETFRPLFHP